jgi:hypothetical protein
MTDPKKLHSNIKPSPADPLIGTKQEPDVFEINRKLRFELDIARAQVKQLETLLTVKNKLTTEPAEHEALQGSQYALNEQPPADWAKKEARELVVEYDLHCEAIDDPDPEWLEEHITALLTRLVESQKEADIKAAQILVNKTMKDGELFNIEKLTKAIRGQR